MECIHAYDTCILQIAIRKLRIAPLLVLFQMVRKMTIAERSAYAKAGAVAEETLANIRTVAAFGAENKETQRSACELSFHHAALVPFS